MKKNGFVFVETIIVVVVLTVGMIMIYSSFSSVLNNSKRRATYDDVAYIYRTYYIQDYISSLDIEEYVSRNLNDDNKIIKFNCENNDYLFKIDNNNVDNTTSQFPTSQEVKKSLCADIMNYYNVSAIYITKYNVSDLKRCTTTSGKIASSCTTSVKNSLNELRTGTIYYLRTLNSNSEDDDSYRLIIVYNDRQIDRDENITKIKVNNEYKCPDEYSEDEGICYRVLNRTYYSNIKMIAKSKL